MINWLISYIGKQLFYRIIHTQYPHILTELMYIYSTDVKHIEFLIDNGVNVETTHPLTGDTSLITSAKNHYTNIEIVKCLVNHSQHKSQFINKENNEGETPLILFVNFADNIIKFLIDNGGDINYKNKYGETFFMYAAKSSFDITYLIQKGGNINNQSINGETALMWAIKDENETNVKILLEHNPNILLETTEHKNAYQIALDVNNASILRMLSEYIMDKSIDINNKYYKYITKYTSEYRFKWKDACKSNDRYEVQKFKHIFNIEDTNVEDICHRLDTEEEKLNQIKQETLDKCINTDNLDGNDIKDIYPENFYTYKENGVTYCEDIRTLFKLLKSFKKRQPPKPVANPYTGKPLSDDIIKDIEDKYKLYNNISTGKQLEDTTPTPTTPSSKDVLLSQISFFYNIMKNLTLKNLFITSSLEQVNNFVSELETINIQSTPLFKSSELQKVKHEDLDKYKYQLIQLLLSKVLSDKYKYIEGDITIYPTREAIQNTWNKIFV